jgi:hypothetical protein
MKKSLSAAIFVPLSTIFSPSFAFFRVHSRFKNSLKDSALRGRIALPGKGEKQKAESRKQKAEEEEDGGRRPAAGKGRGSQRSAVNGQWSLGKKEEAVPSNSSSFKI